MSGPDGVQFRRASLYILGRSLKSINELEATFLCYLKCYWQPKTSTWTLSEMLLATKDVNVVIVWNATGNQRCQSGHCLKCYWQPKTLKWSLSEMLLVTKDVKVVIVWNATGNQRRQSGHCLNKTWDDNKTSLGFSEYVDQVWRM